MLIDKLRSRGLTGRRKKPDQHGFTLIELLVVITILGILAAVVVFSVSGIGDKGEEAAAETDSTILSTAQEAYCAKNGSFADPSILQRDGFLSSESGYNDAYVDTTQGSCGGMSFAVFQPQKTDYPVTIADCLGRRTTYDGPPNKALAAYSGTHELMTYLELLDKTVAPAPQDPNLIPDQYEDDVARGAARNLVDFNALQYAANSPLLHDLVNFSTPTIVDHFANASTAPADLVVFDTPDHVDPAVAGYDAQQVIDAFGAAGKKAAVYVGFGGGSCSNDKALSDPNNPNSPLVDLGRSSLEGVFANIRNLGVIFDVQQKAAEVISQMRARIGEALEKAGAGRNLQVAVTFPFGGMTAGFNSGGSDAGANRWALFPGNHSMNGVINLAGGKNTFADTFLPGGNPGVTTREQIIGRNPDVVVIPAYAWDSAGKPDCTDTFFGGADAPTLTPENLVGTTAIGDTANDGRDRVVCHYFGSMVQPSISSIDIIEAIADELAKGPRTKADNG